MLRKVFWFRSKGVILDLESLRKEKRGRERGIKVSRIDSEKGRELEKKLLSGSYRGLCVTSNIKLCGVFIL